jgi:signal peptidase I
MSAIKKWWQCSIAFLQKDSWSSFVVTLILAFFIIKFIFFPGLSVLTGTGLPLVIVESCSMYHHDGGFEKIFEKSGIYEDNGISLEDTDNWIFPDGFSKGDVIFVVRAKDVQVGDVIIFNAGAAHPVIHRVVSSKDTYATKGDNYRTNSNQLPNEREITEEKIVGKALFKVPLIGWIKLIFFEWSRAPSSRGLC